MFYSLLADIILIIHLTFILFVVFGGFLGLWRKWMVPVHLAAFVWGVLIEFYGWICPLTPIENHYRRMAGAAGYEGGFVEHYIVPVIYPAGLTDHRQYTIAAAVILVNLLVYAMVGYRLWKNRQ